MRRICMVATGGLVSAVALAMAPVQQVAADTASITSAGGATATVGTAFSFTVTTAGAPTPVLRAHGRLPKGVSFTDRHDGTAVVSGVPEATTRGVYPRPAGGTYAVTFTAAFGTGATKVLVRQAFTLTLDQAPTIKLRPTRTVRAGTPFTIPVKTVGFPKPALGESGALPAGVTFTDNGDGTATLGGSTMAAGSYPLSLTASNGVGPPATLSFVLDVTS